MSEDLKNRMNKILILIILACISLKLHSQSRTPNLVLNEITQNEGLADDDVRCILEDRYGFMWFGTRHGLSRYDGYDFQTYLYDPKDSCSLSNNEIYSMCEDREGNLWVGTFVGGLNKYNRESDDFTRYFQDAESPFGLSKSTVQTLCEDSAGNIWLGICFWAEITPDSANLLLRFNPRTGELQEFQHDPGDPGSISCNGILDVYVDRDGTIWAGTLGGLNKFDSRSGDFERFIHDPENPSSLSNDTVYSIYEDPGGRFWVGTQQGLNRFDGEKNHFSRYLSHTGDPKSLSHNIVLAIIGDDNNNLIIRTYNGVDYLNTEAGIVNAWHDQSNIILWFSSGFTNDISSLCLDNAGTLWFSVGAGAVFSLREKRKKFQIHALSTNETGIGPIMEEKSGAVWAGIWGNGLLVSTRANLTIDRKRSNFGGLLEEDPDWIYSYMTHDPDHTGSLSGNGLSSIIQDRAGTIWIGDWVNGTINKFERSGDTERFIHYRPDPDHPYSRPNISTMYEDLYDNLWIGRSDGLDIFDRENALFYHMILDPGKHQGHKTPFLTDIRDGNSGVIWIGTWQQGLFKIIPPVTFMEDGTVHAEKLISYRFDPDMPDDLGEYPVLSLCIPRHNNRVELWIGTLGGGLYGMKRIKDSSGKEVEQFVNYRVSDGLPYHVIWGIQEDMHGNLWLSTDLGLSRFSPERELFNNYNEDDGSILKRFYWRSSHKGESGKFYFGGDEGFVEFYPDSIRDNKHIPPVVITGFRLFNKTVPIGEGSPLKKSILVTEALDLSYRENHLSFVFSALNYINPSKNRYKYMMVGFDKSWIDAGITRSATYTSMRPGKYTFRVTGSNNDGIWNEEGAMIHIRIHPPPWFAWWAYVCYGLLLTGSFFAFRKFLIRREKARADYRIQQFELDKLQEVERMKSRFFANISHEFRTPLSLLIGPINDLLKGPEDLSDKARTLLISMKRNAGRLLNLIRQLLDLSKLEAGKMGLEVAPGNLNQFVASIVRSFQSMAESNKIALESSLPSYEGEIFFDRDKVEKILTNLISNAIKFTPVGGRISIGLVYENKKDGILPDSVEITVKDSGPGIPRDQLSRIFERFYQVSSPDPGEQEGAGIGLSLCKELTEVYRGEIHVESEAGQGSAFTVKLPVSENCFQENELSAVANEISHRVPFEGPGEAFQEINRPGRSVDQYPEAGKDRALILVVEDHQELRTYISRHLLNAYRIEEAGNGKDGLEKAFAIIPDLIICDLMMPVMDGVELCNRLKSDIRTCHIPLIMLTARADRESKIGSLMTGADDYIVKPFDGEELQLRVKNLKESRKKLREKFVREFISDSPDKTGPEYDKFFNRIARSLIKHLSDPGFTMEDLGNELNLSRAQLYRKVTSVTGSPPNELLRLIRMKQAARLLRSGELNVTQVMYMVGMQNPTHFAQTFRKVYGVNPSEYKRSSQLT